jgi:hypothetical protein
MVASTPTGQLVQGSDGLVDLFAFLAQLNQDFRNIHAALMIAQDKKCRPCGSPSGRT